MSEAGSTNRVEVQVARMVVVMVLAFLVTWLPYAAMALAVIMDSSLYIDPIIATIPVYLAKSSTVYNPIIYIFMNRQVIFHRAHLYPHTQAKKRRRKRIQAYIIIINTIISLYVCCVCVSSFEDTPFPLSCADGTRGPQIHKCLRTRPRLPLSTRAKKSHLKNH